MLVGIAAAVPPTACVQYVQGTDQFLQTATLYVMMHVLLC